MSIELGQAERLTINLASSKTPLPRFWEVVMGCDRAIVTLTEQLRRDVLTIKEAIGLKYLRFHAIFNEDVGLVQGKDARGNLILNFTCVDQIYDWMVKNGVRPFVELSFMPPKLAATVAGSSHPFTTHPNVAPPNDWSDWYQLIYRFVAHLVERYGIDEVRQWYFEVWNEPNIDFLAGGSTAQKWTRYVTLYELAARAIKEVSPHLRVGGPATAAASWIPEFIAYCDEHEVPVDFVSTHVYPHGEPRNILGPEADSIAQEDVVAMFMRKIHEQVKASALPHLPVFWTETNAGFESGKMQVHHPYAAAWLARTVALSHGHAEAFGYWTATDAGPFNELGIGNSPFGNVGFGLIAVGGIPKASFNGFRLLHRLGEERLALDSANALATVRNDGALVVALWNFDPAERRFVIDLAGAGGFKYALAYRVDDDHGNALKVWEGMGSPASPTMQQQETLRMAAELPPPEVAWLAGASSLSHTMSQVGLSVIEFHE